MSRVSKQKCDMAADVAAVVHSLMPDVIADMEMKAGDDPTEAREVDAHDPSFKFAQSAQEEDCQVEAQAPRRANQSHSARHSASRSESCIQAASATYLFKPQVLIQVTSTVTKGGRTVKPNSLVNFEPT